MPSRARTDENGRHRKASRCFELVGRGIQDAPIGKHKEPVMDGGKLIRGNDGLPHLRNNAAQRQIIAQRQGESPTEAARLATRQKPFAESLSYSEEFARLHFSARVIM